MPYENIENKRKRRKEYYAENKERFKEFERNKYHTNREAIRARSLALNTTEKKRIASDREKARYTQARLKVIEHYGSQCACCGEAEPLFLEIDHIKNDGKKHRQLIGNSARALVFWIIKNNYPDDFQLLCSNCNQGKKRNGGVCPHKKNTP